MVNLLKLSFVFFSVSLINAITINQVPDYVNNTSNLTDINNTSIEYLNNSTNIFEKDHLEENLSSHRKLLKINNLASQPVAKPPTVNKPTVTISVAKPPTVNKPTVTISVAKPPTVNKPTVTVSVAKPQTVIKPTVTISVTKPPTVIKQKSKKHIDNNHIYRHSNKHTKQTAKQTVDNFRDDRSKNLSPAVKNVLSGNEKKLDTWLSTDLGKNAVKFCMSLGILNKPSIYNGCLEDMMIIKDQKVAKESALSAEEVLSSDHPGTNRRFCQASGDPHCTNYDGSFFHIQEPGIYTIAKTDGFEVQEKMKKNGDNKVGVPSCMIGAIVKVGSIIVEIDVANYKKVLVNGESVDIPENLAMNFGGVQVKYGRQTIEWKGEKAVATGMKVTAKNGFMAMIAGGYCGILEVNVPMSYYGKMQGICGNADGNKNADDFKDVNGKTMDVNYGAKSWEMSGYGGPTSPLSKWQLAWKPKGTSCYFAKECDQDLITAKPVVITLTNKPANAATPVVSAPTVASTTKTPTTDTPVANAPNVAEATKPVTVTTKPPTVAIPVVSAPTVTESSSSSASKHSAFTSSASKPSASTSSASKPSASTSSASTSSASTSSIASSPSAVSVTKPSVESSTTASSQTASSISSSIKNDEKKIKQLFHDVKGTHGFSSEKLQDLKNNILKMISDENKSKEKELSEFQKTILFSKQDLEKINKKYDEKVKEYIALNESITKLEKTMNEHYKQMLSDAKYLLLLDKIKPNFLNTLTSFNEQVRTIKNTIQVNIIEGDDKALMLRIMFKMNEKTTNYTSILSNEFINHYNKYKKRAGLDKSEYDNEYNQIKILKTKYEAQKKLRDSYLIEYKNAMAVFVKMQENYNMGADEIKSFKQIAVFIEKIFNNNYNKC
jgi:hypothetical protein